MYTYWRAIQSQEETSSGCWLFVGVCSKPKATVDAGSDFMPSRGGLRNQCLEWLEHLDVLGVTVKGWLESLLGMRGNHLVHWILVMVFLMNRCSSL